MNWNLEGLWVEGLYLDTFRVKGTVELSRVAYGGRIKHMVVLDEPLSIFGTIRERVSLEHDEVSRVASSAR